MGDEPLWISVALVKLVARKLLSLESFLQQDKVNYHQYEFTSLNVPIVNQWIFLSIYDTAEWTRNPKSYQNKRVLNKR